MKVEKRWLVLADGHVFAGTSFGAKTEVNGELVFNTGMTGYQESITDQSYNGQILTFTYPLIGNYGINRDDFESIVPTTAGVVVNEVARRPSNWRVQMSLDEFLQRKNIPGIADLDTRALTKIIRQGGVLKAALVNREEDVPQRLAELKKINLPTNQVAQVSTKTAYPSAGVARDIVVVDFGLKHSILRELSKRQCNITVLPFDAEAQTILDLAPDGVMLTNGPGDPKSIPQAVKMIQEIQGKVPIFGICLGHQLFSLANGADTYKMKFGHRGFNHAVREIATDRIDFTSQNHGFAVDPQSIDPQKLIVTHVEVNDQSIEGVRHRQFPAFSVQFHPDATPGPHDATHLFDEFMEMIDANIANNKEKINFIN